ncbi:MAG: Na+/H+ antiporter NhaA [Actinomycetota bacterium]|nr:Na+/H+ antiporter NhaA [Actinomycetota bacterium]
MPTRPSPTAPRTRSASPGVPAGIAGVLLVSAVAAAMCWSNLAKSSAEHFWATALPSPGLPHADFGSIGGWVDNGLMAVFFFGVGLEVGRERAHGALSAHRQAILPVLAALGGMGGAALTYFCTSVLAGGGPVARGGWGIPMATDVAFTMAALALLGHRVPPELRAFVVSLAVADDVASVVILAFVAHREIHIWALLAAAAVLAATALFRRRTVRAWWPYAAAAGVSCALFAWAGVEPPLAAAFVGMLVPHAQGASAPQSVREPAGLGKGGPGRRIEPFVAMVSALVVVPVFVLANAGFVLDLHHLDTPRARPVVIGILAARLLGKPAGIFLAVLVAVCAKAATLPGRTSWAQVLGAAALCGIGFTVPLLYAAAEFSGYPTLYAAAQGGLLAGTLLAFLAGGSILAFAHRRQAGTVPGSPERAAQT